MFTKETKVTGIREAQQVMRMRVEQAAINEMETAYKRLNKTEQAVFKAKIVPYVAGFFYPNKSDKVVMIEQAIAQLEGRECDYSGLVEGPKEQREPQEPSDMELLGMGEGEE